MGSEKIGNLAEPRDVNVARFSKSPQTLPHRSMMRGANVPSRPVAIKCGRGFGLEAPDES
jgi:hypothetical protein